MASYDSYDSQSPRYSRPRNEYLKPTTDASGTRRRVGETTSDGQNREQRGQRSPNRHPRKEYDTRYDYPPPLPPDTGRSVPRREHSRLRKRRSWPPLPTCEDEATSLRKEAGSQKLLRELSKNEVPSRGRVDQEPMIEDVPEFINKDERRFVMRERSDVDKQPTPPTSEDERARRKARRRPSKLDMNFKKVDEGVPEILNKRTSSPYAFSKAGQIPAKEEASAGRFLSPDDILSPTPTDSNSRRARAGSKSQPVSPRRDSKRDSRESRPERDYFSLSSGSAIDDEELYGAREKARNKPASYPPSRDAPSGSPRTSVVDFAPAAPQPASNPIRKRNLDARRNTDTEGTLPTMQRLNGEGSRRPGPLAAAAALSGLGVAMASSPQASLSASEYPRPRSRESSYVSSRGPSPAGSAVGAAEFSAPQRSPRVSAEFYRDDSYDRPPTRESSVSSSRPQSPSPRTPNDSPRLPKTDLDWSTLLAANASRKAKPPSRLASSMQQESVPRSRGHMRQASSTTSRVESLPYPVDDGPMSPSVWMPSERTHQYFPESRSNADMPIMQEPKTFIRPESTAPGSSAYPSVSTSRLGARPSMPTRHSTADVPQRTRQNELEKPRANEGKRTAQPASSETKKELQALMKKPLPPCSRIELVAGHMEWYTLIGAPSLDFCPDCVADVFDRTIFRNSFRRSPPMNLNTPAQCALGGLPWIRLAWLLTLQQQRTDLRLLQDLAEVEETSKPCPGNDLGMRTWYGLRDADGYFLKDFRICYADVRKIESLLPTLSGMFVRLPQRTADEKGLCAIRPEGNRFSIYIDALISTHEKALAARSNPNPKPFISLVKWRSRMPECGKDNLLKNGLWHFMPNLPELTVCEDCFATVVEPEIERDNDIAMRFNRTIQPVYGEGIGLSCQLYSPRMRKVFARAIRDKDMKYLARKARERRDAELRLQDRYRAVVDKAKRLSWNSADGRDDERTLNREINRISEEWKAEWE